MYPGRHWDLPSLLHPLFSLYFQRWMKEKERERKKKRRGREREREKETIPFRVTFLKMSLPTLLSKCLQGISFPFFLCLYSICHFFVLLVSFFLVHVVLHMYTSFTLSNTESKLLQVRKTNLTCFLQRTWHIFRSSSKNGRKIGPHVSHLRSRWFLFQGAQVHFWEPLTATNKN